MSEHLLLQAFRLPGGDEPRDVWLEGGKIAAIEPASQRSAGGAALIEGAGRLLLLPGLIDAHVHFRDPGHPHKGDFASESRAALAGGVTAVLDMPNTEPPTLTVKDLEAKRARSSSISHVHFGFHMGTSPANASEILAARNIPGVKIYMNETTGHLAIEDEEALDAIFSLGVPVAVHAEDEKLALAIELWHRRRPPFLYACHISTCREIEMLARAGGSGRIFGEATPHHLLLTEADARKAGGRLRVRPPLKRRSDALALWQALRPGGPIQTVATDHAPHTLAEKDGPAPPYGLPGVEILLPLLLDACLRDGRLSILDIVRLAATGPSRIFGIEGKGRLEVGADADLVLVDPDLEQVVDPHALHCRVAWSPYEGRRLRGWPVATLLMGELAWSRETGFGRPMGRELRFDPAKRRLP